MSRYVNPVTYAIDSNGDPISGAKLYFYETGTTTAKTIYSDEALTTSTDNPQVADASGRFSNDIYIDGVYKIVLKNASDVTIWTKDPVGDIIAGQDVTFANMTISNTSPKFYLYDSDAGTNSKYVVFDGAGGALSIGFPQDDLLSTGLGISLDRSGNLTCSGGNYYLGINNLVQGIAHLYGRNTGGNDGGEVRLYTADDYNATFAYFAIDANQDDFRITTDTGRQFFSIDPNDSQYTVISAYDSVGVQHTCAAFGGSTPNANLYYDASLKFNTTSAGALVTGSLSVSGAIDATGATAFATSATFNDDGSATSWARVDWDNSNVATNGIIYQDQAGTFIVRNDGNSGTVKITSKDSGGTAREGVIVGGATPNVQLNYNGNSVLTTTATGIDLDAGNQLTFDLTTEDDGFIDFKATADADATSAISTLTTSGAVTHHIQVNINGTKAWIPASTNNPS